MVAKDRFFRVLSLDGGGAWSLIQLRALLTLFGEQVSGHDVLTHFDLVVANSGGSIVAAALACNLRVHEVLERFLSKTNREMIFRPRTSVFPGFQRYKTAEKRKGLAAVLGTAGSQRMDEWGEQHRGRLAQVIIVGHDYDRERARFFRTDGRTATASAASGLSASFIDAVHASSTPPVLFFDEPAIIKTFLPNAAHGKTLRFWDGAIAGFNNPVMVGIIEALATRVGETPRSRESVRVLSLGTGMVRLLPNEYAGQVQDRLVTPRPGTGVLDEISKLAGAIVDDPPDTATFMAHVMLGGRLPARPSVDPAITDGPLVRLNPLIQPRCDPQGHWTVPTGFTLDEFTRLAALELDAIAQDEVDLIDRAAQLWIAGFIANQPIRAAWPVKHAEVGHARFAEARAALSAWLV